MTQILTNIDVPDLIDGLRFYQDGLGFKPVRTLFDGTVAELLAGTCVMYLIERKAGTPASTDNAARRDYSPHWTPVHLDMVVDDLETALARALAAGATLSGEPTDHNWGKLAPLRDPFGHGICLIQFLDSGYDQVEDGVEDRQELNAKVFPIPGTNGTHRDK